MSKPRTHARLRQNDDFKAFTRYLAEIGLTWRVEGKGTTKHPFLVIRPPVGDEIQFIIAGTPRAGCARSGNWGASSRSCAGNGCCHDRDLPVPRGHRQRQVNHAAWCVKVGIPRRRTTR